MSTIAIVRPTGDRLLAGRISPNLLPDGLDPDIVLEESVGLLHRKVVVLGRGHLLAFVVRCDGFIHVPDEQALVGGIRRPFVRRTTVFEEEVFRGRARFSNPVPAIFWRSVLMPGTYWSQTRYWPEPPT